MPTPPKTAAKAAAQLQVQSWDDYVAEATAGMTPFQKQLPDGSLLEVPCPTSDQMEAANVAQQREDSTGLVVAIVGDEQAPKVLELTATLPFTVRLRLCNDVMMHYGMGLAGLPES